MTPDWFVPAPPGLFPRPSSVYEASKQGAVWNKAQQMGWDRPPTRTCHSGYVVVAVLGEERLPTGTWKVGLNPRYTVEGMKEEASACGVEYEQFLEETEKYYGEPIERKYKQAPYLVNTMTGTCSCPYYKKFQVTCKHNTFIHFVLAFCNPVISPTTGRVIFSLGK